MTLTSLGSSTCTGDCRAVGPAVGEAEGLRYDGEKPKEASEEEYGGSSTARGFFQGTK